jgi:hypothetical protein
MAPVESKMTGEPSVLSNSVFSKIVETVDFSTPDATVTLGKTFIAGKML